ACALSGSIPGANGVRSSIVIVTDGTGHPSPLDSHSWVERRAGIGVRPRHGDQGLSVPASITENRAESTYHAYTTSARNSTWFWPARSLPLLSGSPNSSIRNGIVRWIPQRIPPLKSPRIALTLLSVAAPSFASPDTSEDTAAGTPLNAEIDVPRPSSGNFLRPSV